MNGVNSLTEFLSKRGLDKIFRKRSDFVSNCDFSRNGSVCVIKASKRKFLGHEIHGLALGLQASFELAILHG